MFIPELLPRLLRMAGIVLLFSCQYLSADETQSQIYIKNVDIFDGRNETLKKGHNILVEGNVIKSISAGDVSALDSDAVVIDGGGRVMVPGLIDTHSHLSIVETMDKMRDWSWERIGVLMGKRAETTLMWGFTTVRDLGGPVMGLKQNIDGRSGARPAYISITGIHHPDRRPRRLSCLDRPASTLVWRNGQLGEVRLLPPCGWCS